jgi:hypothetical protein
MKESQRRLEKKPKNVAGSANERRSRCSISCSFRRFSRLATCVSAPSGRGARQRRKLSSGWMIYVFGIGSTLLLPVSYPTPASLPRTASQPRIEFGGELEWIGPESLPGAQRNACTSSQTLAAFPSCALLRSPKVACFVFVQRSPSPIIQLVVGDASWLEFPCLSAVAIQRRHRSNRLFSQADKETVGETHTASRWKTLAKSDPRSRKLF